MKRFTDGLERRGLVQTLSWLMIAKCGTERFGVSGTIDRKVVSKNLIV